MAKKPKKLPYWIKYYDPNHPMNKLAMFRIGVKWKIQDFRKKHKVTFTLLIIFIILFLANMIKDGVIGFGYSKLTGGFELKSESEFLDSLKDKPSDISGITQYDKYAMGLDYRDNSDTDHDGLTDKEEIEKYKTDPLKSSTSGDFYTDGYKVSKKMDLTKHYELQEDQTFINNECSEVTLTARSATDFTAAIEDCSTRYSLKNWGIDKLYKGYFIYNFEGTFTTDISDILSKNGITASDISVWTYDGAFLTYGKSDLKECKYTANENKISIDYPFDKEKYTYVFISPKRTLLNSLISGFGDKQVTQMRRSDNPHFLIVHALFSNRVYYPVQENKANETEMVQKISSAYKIPKAEYIPVSQSEIDIKYNIYKTVLPIFNFNNYGKRVVSSKEAFTTYLPAVLFFYQYCDYDTTTIDAALGGSNSEEGFNYKYANYHTTFDPNKDELPFQNFSSKYSNGGNCAGFNYLTCFLYNQGYFPESDSYDGISWDLTTDPENKTLMDRGLADYKTKDFVDTKSYLTNRLEDGLTEGESQFVDMIGASWRMTNDNLIQSCLESYRINNKNGLSWDVAEKVIERLDQGKIVTLSLYLNDKTGHQIVIYDYYYINETELAFRVYDCNIPMNHSDDKYLNCDGACYLQCKKVKNQTGGYNLLYLYYPVEGATNYFASSDPGLCQYSATLISDETLKAYNH